MPLIFRFHISGNLSPRLESSSRTDPAWLFATNGATAWCQKATCRCCKQRNGSGGAYSTSTIHSSPRLWNFTTQSWVQSRADSYAPAKIDVTIADERPKPTVAAISTTSTEATTTTSNAETTTTAIAATSAIAREQKWSWHPWSFVGGLSEVGRIGRDWFVHSCCARMGWGPPASTVDQAHLFEGEEIWLWSDASSESVNNLNAKIDYSEFLRKFFVLCFSRSPSCMRKLGSRASNNHQQTHVPLTTSCRLLLVLPLEGKYTLYEHICARDVFFPGKSLLIHIERYSWRSSSDFIHLAPKWHIPSLVGNLVCGAMEAKHGAEEDEDLLCVVCLASPTRGNERPEAFTISLRVILMAFALWWHMHCIPVKCGWEYMGWRYGKLVMMDLQLGALNEMWMKCRWNPLVCSSWEGILVVEVEHDGVHTMNSMAWNNRLVTCAEEDTCVCPVWPSFFGKAKTAMDSQEGSMLSVFVGYLSAFRYIRMASLITEAERRHNKNITC